MQDLETHCITKRAPVSPADLFPLWHVNGGSLFNFIYKVLIDFHIPSMVFHELIYLMVPCSVSLNLAKDFYIGNAWLPYLPCCFLAPEA